MSDNVLYIVIVGDGMVGKTCLLHRYFDDKFELDTCPTIFDETAFEKEVDGITHTVQLIDTAGQEDYENLRKMFYDQANCLILCFSVNFRTSFQNIEHWLKEIPSHKKDVPIILCATQIDQRENNLQKCVREEEGKQLAKKIKARCYVECSAKTKEGVHDVIVAAIREAARPDYVETEEVNAENCWGNCSIS